jgi:hypothetical protein
MTFKETYKKLKKLPDTNFLLSCLDWGDLWEFELSSRIPISDEVIFGGTYVVSKKTGELLSMVSVYTDLNRTSKPTPIPVPRFAAEGWDYYDEKTDTFKLKPDAPNWAKQEFEEFYGTDEFEHEPYSEPARVVYA